MSRSKVRLVPYETVSPGLEAAYTGETVSSPDELSQSGPGVWLDVDCEGNVFQTWSSWTWTLLPNQKGQEPDWDEEIHCINEMQAALGPLSDSVRKIRAHIGSLVPCHIGFPVTVDEVLGAISGERLPEPSFKNGCWNPCVWWEAKTNQPRHVESMAIIERILKGYLDGKDQEELTAQSPQAEGFVRRTFEWLGPVSSLSKLQLLLLERVLLPFEYLSRHSRTDPRSDSEEGYLLCTRVSENILGPEGRGAEIDTEIAAIAGLPRLDEQLLDAIEDERTRALCKLYRSRISDPFYGELCDCHHNSFRLIESSIHDIGTATTRIPTRKPGAERERLGRLLFGYVLGLDRWLLGVPMQFLLLDLGHMDLGFDPRNEILRVYAYLGEDNTGVKEWLAACLWHNLMYNPIFGNPGGLVRHEGLLEQAHRLGISLREWMDSRLQQTSPHRSRPLTP